MEPGVLISLSIEVPTRIAMEGPPRGQRYKKPRNRRRLARRRMRAFERVERVLGRLGYAPEAI